MKNTKISIIVPVYNTYYYLEKCVNSLLMQTYSGFEILLIDDESTDESYRLCQQFESLDERIHAYTKPNGGLADVRNFGISKAQGEYLLFLDSDDWFESDMLESYVKQIEKSSYDVIIQGFTIDFEDEENSHQNTFDKDTFYIGDEVQQGIFDIECLGLLNSSCNKLYRKAIIDDNFIYFSVGKEPAEDLLFNCRYFVYVKSIACLAKASYHYIKRNVQTLTVKYISKYDQKILEYHEARSVLYTKIGMQEKHRMILLNNSLATYTLTVFSNMYRDTSPLNFKEREDIIFKLYQNTCIIQAVLSSEYCNFFLKLLRTLVKTKNALLTNIIFTLLYACRYRFETVYFKLRRKILYSKKMRRKSWLWMTRK